MKYKTLSKITSVFLCTSLIFPSIAEAHSGGTNSEGCHNQTSNNTYHCHNSGSDSSGVSDSTLYIVGGAIVVGTIIYLINRKNKYTTISKKHSSMEKPISYKQDDSYRLNKYRGDYSGINSTFNNNNTNKDVQTSIVFNDYFSDKTKRDISLSLNDFNISETPLFNDENQQMTMNQFAMSQIIEAMQYKPAFSIKSIGLQKDDYHLELQYKF